MLQLTYLVINLEEVSVVCLVGTLDFTAAHALYTTGCGRNFSEIVGGRVEGEGVGVTALVLESLFALSDCWQLWDLVWETAGTDRAVSQVSGRCTCGMGTVNCSWLAVGEGDWSEKGIITELSWGVSVNWGGFFSVLSWLIVYWWSTCLWCSMLREMSTHMGGCCGGWESSSSSLSSISSCRERKMSREVVDYNTYCVLHKMLSGLVPPNFSRSKT